MILDQPIQLDEYGALAVAGSLDGLATLRGRQDVTFTASGYGLSDSSPVTFESYRERLMGKGKLTNLRSALTDGINQQSNGNGKGKGGTCSGDSGGPVFYGGYESNTIVAGTSFGLSQWCRGVDFAYRTDTAVVTPSSPRSRPSCPSPRGRDGPLLERDRTMEVCRLTRPPPPASVPLSCPAAAG